MHPRTRLQVFLLLVLFVSGLNRPVSADPVSNYNVAVEFYNQKRWQLVADSCAEFLAKYPTHERAPSTRLFWAQSLLHLKKYAESRRQFEEFLNTSPDHAERPLAIYRIGECSYFLGDDEQVEIWFNSFLKSNPTHPLAEWAMMYLGESQLRQKRYELAIATLEKSLATYPQGELIDDVEYNLAGAYQGLGQTAKATEILDRILARPNSSRAFDATFLTAARLFDEQKYAESAASFQKLADSSPQHRLVGNARLNAGYSLYNLQNFAEAMTQFRKAQEFPQFKMQASYWLALSQKSVQDYPAACKTLLEMLSLEPTSPIADRATFQLADCEFRQGNYSVAVTRFGEVFQKWPQSDLADDALHYASEAALQANELSRVVELNTEFAKAFPQSPLKSAQNIVFARALISQAEQQTDEQSSKPLLEQAQTVLRENLKQSLSTRLQFLTRFHLARVLERLSQNDQIAEVLAPVLTDPATKQFAEYKDILLLNANAKMRVKKYDEAIKSYQDYLTIQPDSTGQGNALSLLIRAYTEDAQHDQALKTLLDAKPDAAQKEILGRTALNLADSSLEARKFEIASQAYEYALNADLPEREAIQALSGLAHSQFDQKSFDSAAASFLKLWEASTADELIGSHAAYMSALSLQHAEKKQEALERYEKAFTQYSQVAKSGDRSSEEIDVALNAYRMEKAAAALARDLDQTPASHKFYEAAYDELKALPESSRQGLDELLNEWAEMAYGLEDYESSDRIYQMLLSETPTSPRASYASLVLAESALLSDRSDEAKKLFEQLANNQADNPFVRQRALVHLLDLANSAQDWEEVRRLSTELKTSFAGGPHNFYAGYRYAESLLKEKKYQEAADSLNTLKKELPEDLTQAPPWWGEVWLMEAESQFWLKNYPQMNELLKELSIKNPSPTLQYRILALEGRALENQAQFAEARETYLKVINSEAGRGTETAADSQFRIAESYMKEGNLPVALREYYKVYSGYAVPRLRAAALFQAAGCDANMKHYQESIDTYQKLIAEFPESEFTEKAQKRIIEIQALQATN